MNKKHALLSLMAFVFCSGQAQVSVDTTGGTTGGAVSASPISNSASSVGSVSTGASTSQGGAGGTGGSVGNLSTGASTSSSGASSATSGSSISAGGQSSSSGNTSGNTSVSSTYVAPKIPVSTAYSPGNFPTAPCMGATSLGTSGVMFGFSAGSSWEATECMRLEMARSFEQAGHTQDAQAVRCSSKYAVDAPSCIKLREEKAGVNRREKPLVAPLEIPEQPQQPQAIQFIEGAYFESIDPETGFKTIIDIRDSYRHVAMP